MVREDPRRREGRVSTRITTVSASAGPSVRSLLAELWAYRGLVWAFSARDLKVKYFQTIFGPLWVVLTPLITVGVMTFVFGLMIKVPSDDLPYLVFYLVAIVPWLAFIAVFSQTMTSLEAHGSLLSKIYFPRLVIGASYAVNGTIDFLVGFAAAVAAAAAYGILTVTVVLAMPVLLAIQMAWALGLGFLLAPWNAQYRDVKHVIPLVIQLYYFASPILYSVSVAPSWMKWMYAVNPLAVVVTAYRSLLNGHPLDWPALAWALVASFAVLAWGAVAFMRREQEMVDVL
ncbi:MAG: ABC transporter permease [Betaproteobacteria bacterium]|nr:ABC transporter permease [Betaproteobacteria bacterium]